MRHDHIFAALALFLALACYATAQDTTPGASVQLANYPGAPFEARDGNLWFSTVQEGLIRYDGTAFVPFPPAGRRLQGRV